ncbi:MAG: chromosome segregation protein SMC [Clostridia bacterium]|nr:chromosome segregation protein SMC [Clostridia bacterium]
MYLKRVELQGFKSFADKTVIEVGTGVTGIVGPNGSGKSNISDALRWVMGEMSAKSLRSGNMQDVIFNGTQKRKQLSFAEVTLVLDNESRFFQSDFNEIAVTRRVFRSGESEYLINGAQVRLKDIHELFMDTGLGREGYSVVGQGRIDELLSAKAENRRQVFEEAAGISKYRHRKDEAERKLEKTEENLVRVRDVLNELEGRVGPLQRQSEKARKYLDLREELKGIEVSASVDIIDKNREEVKKYDELLKIAGEDSEREKKLLESYEKESDELYALLKESDEKTSELREELDKAKDEHNNHANNIKLLTNNIENYKTNILSVEAEMGANDRLTADAKKSLLDMAKEEEAVRAKLEELNRELTSLEADGAVVSDDMATKGVAVEQVRSKIRDMERALSEADTKSASLEVLKESIETRRFSIEADITQSRDGERRMSIECERLARDIDEAKKAREGAEKVFIASKSESDDINRAIDEKKDEFNRLSSLIGEKQGRLRMLEEMERALEGYQRSVKDLINAHKEGRYPGRINGIFSKLIGVPKEYSTAIEVALGGAMQNVVVPDEQDAKQAVNYLKEHKLGRVTFLPLSSQEKRRLEGEGKILKEKGVIGIAADLVERESFLDNTVESLLGRVVVTDNQDNAIRLAKANRYKFKIVTLSGEVFQPGGSITGGSMNRASSVLGREEEIEELKKEVKRLDSLSEKAEDAIDDLMDKADEVEEKREAARETLSEKDISLSRLVAEKNAVETRLNEEKERLLRLEKEKEEIAYKIANNETLKREYILEKENVRKELKRAEAELEEKQKALSEAMSRKDEASSRLFEKKMELTSVEKDIDLIKERANLTKIRIENLEAENRAKTATKEMVINNIARCENEILLCKKDMEESEKKVNDIEAAIIAQAQGKTGTDERVGILRDEIRRLNDTIYSLQNEAVRLESEKSKIDYRIETAVNRLWDEYEMTYSEAKECYVPSVSIPEAQKRIASLRGAIKALGNVNVDAIEEYKEVKDRYEFLSNQVKDMEEGKASLEKLIKEITVVMKDIFAEKFVVINTYFGEIFQELFGGGKASVSLIDKENILESGIEIEVQPPGKKLLSINLLSGGEKALTAIALLFALMKVSPSPFVVLDEIEAALDDINVYRFANYMRNRVDTTQFIVITHRRGTMESADVLYGVTMQEKGVSKLLSMSLKDVKEYEEV